MKLETTVETLLLQKETHDRAPWEGYALNSSDRDALRAQALVQAKEEWIVRMVGNYIDRNPVYAVAWIWDRADKILRNEMGMEL